MNFKTTYILFGVLIVIFGVFAVVLFYDPGSKDTGNYVLPQFQNAKEPLKADDIDRVEIQRNEPKQATLVLQRDGKQWSITEPVEARADKAAVDNLIHELAAATRTKVDKPPSLSAWGLEPPQAVIILKKGSEKTITLNVGKDAGVGDAAVVYVLDPNRPKEPMAVRKPSLDAVFKQLPDYRDPTLLTAMSDDIRAVKLSEDKKEPLELEKKEGRWVYTIPADYGDAETSGQFAAPGFPRPLDNMNALLTDLTKLKLDKPAEDIVTDNVKDGDLAKYNLDDKAAILHVQVGIVDKDKAVELLIGVGKKVDDKTDKYFAKLANEKTIVRVPAAEIDALRKLLDDRSALRNKTLVTLDKPIDAVDVANGSGIVRLRRQEGMPPPMMPGHPMPPNFSTDTWTLWRDDATSSQVDSQTMSAPTSLLSLLKQKDLIKSFIDLAPADKRAAQEDELQLNKPTAVVSLWSGDDGIMKEEPPKEGEKPKDSKPKAPKLKSSEPTMRITFGKQVKEAGVDMVVVKRETKRKVGDKTTYDVTLAKIQAAPVLDQAKKGPLAYMDKQIPPYFTGTDNLNKSATKLVIQRPSGTLEMTRAKDSESWMIVKPDSLANHMADPDKIGQVLHTMNDGLIAAELIADKAEKNDLEKVYGLEPPQTRVEITLTKDDKPTTYTVLLGKDGPKAGQNETVYAKVSWRDTIFTLDKIVLAEIPADFQDTTVAKFDPAKVKTIKLTGWQNIVGTPFTVDLERKDTLSWTNKNSPDSKLDPKKVAAFLDSLANLKAEKFVAKLPKPDADLDPATGPALKIEITFEKDEKPLELVIGKLDGDFYLATSNRVPGEVFHLKKAIFEGAKSKPAFFNP
jgi:hypothetical protein